MFLPEASIGIRAYFHFTCSDQKFVHAPHNNLFLFRDRRNKKVKQRGREKQRNRETEAERDMEEGKGIFASEPNAYVRAFMRGKNAQGVTGENSNAVAINGSFFTF